MAIAFSTGQRPVAIERTTTNGTADTGDQVTLPSWTRTLLIQNIGSDVVKVSLTDGNTDWWTIQPGVTLALPVTKAEGTLQMVVWLESPTISNAIELMAVDRVL